MPRIEEIDQDFGKNSVIQICYTPTGSDSDRVVGGIVTNVNDPDNAPNTMTASLDTLIEKADGDPIVYRFSVHRQSVSSAITDRRVGELHGIRVVRE